MTHFILSHLATAPCHDIGTISDAHIYVHSLLYPLVSPYLYLFIRLCYSSRSLRCHIKSSLTRVLLPTCKLILRHPLQYLLRYKKYGYVCCCLQMTIQINYFNNSTICGRICIIDGTNEYFFVFCHLDKTACACDLQLLDAFKTRAASYSSPSNPSRCKQSWNTTKSCQLAYSRGPNCSSSDCRTCKPIFADIHFCWLQFRLYFFALCTSLYAIKLACH